MALRAHGPLKQMGGSFDKQAQERIAKHQESVLRGRVSGCLEKSVRSRARFREALRAWFGVAGKDYPWRRTRDPYAVLVSELMLQQTRLATVLEKSHYVRFMERFPDVKSLALADDESLLKAWEGLGYYRRARMLREAARAILQDHGGTMPSGLAALRSLPGIGEYTANAMRAFAFDAPAVVVDGNIARVLARLADLHEEIDSGAGKRAIHELAGLLADDGHPRAYHSALMELGQQLCKVGAPMCAECPVSGFCKAENPSSLPKKRPRVGITKVVEHAIWRRRDGAVLLHRAGGARRTGLWHLPVRTEDEVSGMKELLVTRYPITRYSVELRVWSDVTSSASLREGECWIRMDEVDGLAMATPMRRALMRLLEEKNRM